MSSSLSSLASSPSPASLGGGVVSLSSAVEASDAASESGSAFYAAHHINSFRQTHVSDNGV